jgi:hypothetical protein
MKTIPENQTDSSFSSSQNGGVKVEKPAITLYLSWSRPTLRAITYRSEIHTGVRRVGGRGCKRRLLISALRISTRLGVSVIRRWRVVVPVLLLMLLLLLLLLLLWCGHLSSGRIPVVHHNQFDRQAKNKSQPI